jgi:protein-tyrosine phosphatase
MWTTIHGIVAPCGRLSVAPRPRGGDWLEDELTRWRRLGVTTLVIALRDDELAELELGQERACALACGMEVVRLPIKDRGLPDDPRAFWAVCGELAARMREGAHVLVHCRQGIGRASLIAAGVLVCLGVEVEEAWGLVEQGRGRPVPDTPEQRAWLEP